VRYSGGKGNWNSDPESRQLANQKWNLHVQMIAVVYTCSKPLKIYQPSYEPSSATGTNTHSAELL